VFSYVPLVQEGIAGDGAENRAYIVFFCPILINVENHGGGQPCHVSLFTVCGVVWPRLTQSCWCICGDGLPHVVRCLLAAFRNPGEVHCAHCAVMRRTRGITSTRGLSLSNAPWVNSLQSVL